MSKCKFCPQDESQSSPQDLQPAPASPAEQAEISGIVKRIGELETALDSKNSHIERLQEILAKAHQEISQLKDDLGN